MSKNMQRQGKFRPPSRLLTSRRGATRGAGLKRPQQPRPLAGLLDEYIVLRSLATTVRDGLICQSTSAGHTTKLQTAHLILNRLFIGHILLLYDALFIQSVCGRKFSKRSNTVRIGGGITFMSFIIIRKQAGQVVGRYCCLLFFIIACWMLSGSEFYVCFVSFNFCFVWGYLFNVLVNLFFV